MRPSGSNCLPTEGITGWMIPSGSYCPPTEVITGG